MRRETNDHLSWRRRYTKRAERGLRNRRYHNRISIIRKGRHGSGKRHLFQMGISHTHRHTHSLCECSRIRRCGLRTVYMTNVVLNVLLSDCCTAGSVTVTFVSEEAVSTPVGPPGSVSLPVSPAASYNTESSYVGGSMP